MKTKMSIIDFKKYKEEGKKFTMVTAYDYTFASIINESETEAILVGDSAGMLVQGLKSTVPVTMDEMVYHIRCVVAGAPNTFIVGDMPFGSYNESCEQAIHNANRLIKEGGCDCIKLEGGVDFADKIAAIVKSGTPVMGHIGMTPQTASSFGGFKVQGKDLKSAKKLIEDAKTLEEAGCFMIGIECVPVDVTKAISKAVSIPINSIGSGIYSDGPGMITQDMLGMYGDFKAKFVKRYANLRPVIVDALNTFHRETNEGIYPSDEESFNIKIEGLES